MILVIYVLCTFTALTCAVLLLRSARRSGVRMLFWCGLFFSLLAVANALVIVDHYLFPDLQLWPVRNGTSLLAIAVLLYGLIFEER